MRIEWRALVPLLAVLTLCLSGAVRAEPTVLSPERGLRPVQLGVVINRRDPASVRIGRIYAQRRGIPAANVVELEFEPNRSNLHPGEFAVLKRQLDQQLPNSVQAMALAWTTPYRVGCMSITSAFAFGYDRAYCADGCKWTESNPYAGSDSRAPYDDYRIRPAMMLAATDEQQALALIERGIAADRSLPQGTVYLVRTPDKARSSRAPMFPIVANAFAGRIPIEIVQADGLHDRDDVLMYMTGAANVPDLNSNHYVAGALADHLTSFGGRLTDSSQMSALRWLQAGATASYGTVVEPCNFVQKFPNPLWLLQSYLAGESAIEAYWKSVQMPGQGVFIGEPLARPFAGYRLEQDGDGQWWIRSPLLAAGAYNLYAAARAEGPFQRVASALQVTDLQPGLPVSAPLANFYQVEPLQDFGQAPDLNLLPFESEYERSSR